MRFVITDTQADITVLYKGILPDLFAEGKGAVAQGKLMEDGVFAAHEVLAKHDENYMPPEVATALEQAHREGVGNPAAHTTNPTLPADSQP
jgi:cytochrome c-type biogenesis protein CcmE